MRLFMPAVMTILAATMAAAAEPQAAAETKSAISAHELNSKYEVRGPLGVPLGEIVTIVCRKKLDDAKRNADLVEVFSVNGTDLPRPVVMEYAFFLAQNSGSIAKKLAGGQRQTLRVYQTGGFTGIPNAAMQETVSVQTQAYAFTTHLVVLKRLK
jgi:hypothetical protein